MKKIILLTMALSFAFVFAGEVRAEENSQATIQDYGDGGYEVELSENGELVIKNPTNPVYVKNREKPGEQILSCGQSVRLSDGTELTAYAEATWSGNQQGYWKSSNGDFCKGQILPESGRLIIGDGKQLCLGSVASGICYCADIECSNCTNACQEKKDNSYYGNTCDVEHPYHSPCCGIAEDNGCVNSEGGCPTYIATYFGGAYERDCQPPQLPTEPETPEEPQCQFFTSELEFLQADYKKGQTLTGSIFGGDAPVNWAVETPNWKPELAEKLKWTTNEKTISINIPSECNPTFCPGILVKTANDCDLKMANLKYNKECDCGQTRTVSIAEDGTITEVNKDTCVTAPEKKQFQMCPYGEWRSYDDITADNDLRREAFECGGLEEPMIGEELLVDITATVISGGTYIVTKDGVKMTVKEALKFLEKKLLAEAAEEGSASILERRAFQKMGNAYQKLEALEKKGITSGEKWCKADRELAKAADNLQLTMFSEEAKHEIKLLKVEYKQKIKDLKSQGASKEEIERLKDELKEKIRAHKDGAKQAREEYKDMVKEDKPIKEDKPTKEEKKANKDQAGTTTKNQPTYDEVVAKYKKDFEFLGDESGAFGIFGKESQIVLKGELKTAKTNMGSLQEGDSYINIDLMHVPTSIDEVAPNPGKDDYYKIIKVYRELLETGGLTEKVKYHVTITPNQRVSELLFSDVPESAISTFTPPQNFIDGAVASYQQMIGMGIAPVPQVCQGENGISLAEAVKGVILKVE